MERRRPGRPSKGFPYVVGGKPYKHRRQWRVLVATGQVRGRRRGVFHYFDSPEKARAWIRGYERTRRAAGRTVEDAVIEYTAHLRRKGNKPGSLATTGYRLRAILDYSMPLIDLNPRRAQDLYDELVDEGGAVDTQHGCLVQARAFGRFCQKETWLPHNPFESIEAVGRKSRGKDQLRIDEGRKFTSYCFKVWREDKDRAAIAALLTLLLNLRASEVALLGARDVDDRGRLLWIAEEDVAVTGGARREGAGKTDAARRRAVVPKVLVAPMAELAAAPATEGGHLFALDNGLKPADRHWVSRAVRRMLAGAKVPIVTTHGLRGTHATFATVQGVTGEAVARAMGHENPSMTESTYIDAELAADAQAERVTNALVDDPSAADPPPDPDPETGSGVGD